MNPNPSPTDAAKIRAALDGARRGQASISEIAAAYEIAERSKLPGCAAELRKHLHDKLDTPRRSVERDVVLGVATGALTHFLLRGL